ncbi:MAG: histidine kinase [Cytophagales bacterium]
MNRVFIHNPFFRLCSAPVFGVMVYLLIILINNTVEDVNELFNNQELYVCIGLSFISFESMRLIIWFLESRSQEKSFEIKIAYQVILTLMVSLILIGLSISAYFRYVVGFSIGNSELNIFLLIFGAAGLLYNTLYFSQIFLFRENKSRIEQERTLSENLESEFVAFQNEVNPDLLYESLENLILTLHQSADKAEEYIDCLASIYRHSIVNRDKELISLQEELRALDQLVCVLNNKFQNQIHLNLSALDNEKTLIIPGALLVSLDAIVRNTLISAEAPLEVKFNYEDGYLIMSHRINDRLKLHQHSIDAFMRLQRSYSFFSEIPFVQVKANKENYIKFPAMKVSEPTHLKA